jgi:ribosomal protein L11
VLILYYDGSSTSSDSAHATYKEFAKETENIENLIIAQINVDENYSSLTSIMDPPAAVLYTKSNKLGTFKLPGDLSDI